MKFIAFLVVLLLASVGLGQNKETLCTVKTKLDLTKNCQGKKVMLSGTISKSVSAHPIMTSPSYPFQNYLDISLGQIVLLSSKDIACTKKLEVTGVLGWKNMGGAPGTRDSYQNAFLNVERFVCR